jgi:hypothetical protein
MQRRFLMLGAIGVSIWLSSCAGVVKPGPVLTVNVLDPFSTIQADSPPVQLTATVNNDRGNKGVKWSLSLAGNSCSPGCGTLVPANTSDLNLAATYTPPLKPPLNQTATITASSIADRSKQFAFNITITPSVVVSVSPKFSSVIAGGAPIPLTATVTNDPANAGVTWSLTAGGSACTTCGSLLVPPSPAFTAVYVPPQATPTGTAASPTITATSVTNPNISDGFSFTFSPPTALFKGSYAFLLRGYDVAGSPMAMAGSVTADGNGNITSGEFDVDNDGGITHAPSPLMGTYTITPANGALRGAITITNFHFTQGGSNVVFKFALSADGTNGSIVELDGVGYRNSGTIQLQDSSALSAANIAGSYAFGLDSDAPVGGRIVEEGQLVIAGSSVTGVVDQSKAGDPIPKYSDTPLDSGSSTAPDSSGRGTLSLTIQGTTSTYAYYLVNSSQLILVQTDPGHTFGTAQGGVARRQRTLAAGSIFGTSVIQMTGMDVNPTTKAIGPDVIVGVMNVAPGNQNGSFFNLTFDSNDIGIILPAHPTGGFVTAFDPTTGRGVLNVPGGFQTGFVNSATFYLYDNASGFIIDSDPSTSPPTPPDQASTNNAFSGTFVPQAQPPFATTSLSGGLIFRSGSSAIPQIPNVTAGIAVDNVHGVLSGAGDLTSLDSQAGNVPDITFGGQYEVLDTSLGRGLATLPAGFLGDFSLNPFQPDNAVFYLIGPNQLLMIGAQSSINSGVMFFTPQ